MCVHATYIILKCVYTFGITVKRRRIGQHPLSNHWVVLIFFI